MALHGSSSSSGSAGSLTLITETVTSGSAANVSFTSIAATYRDLEVRIRGRGTKVATLCSVRMRFNADTGTNYDWLDQEIRSGTVIQGEGVGVAFINVGYLGAASAPSNTADIISAVIGDYRGTTFQKACCAQSTVKAANSTTNVYTMVTSGWWRSTSAITQIDIFPDSNAFVDGTVVSLYGRM